MLLVLSLLTPYRIQLFLYVYISARQFKKCFEKRYFERLIKYLLAFRTLVYPWMKVYLTIRRVCIVVPKNHLPFKQVLVASGRFS